MDQHLRWYAVYVKSRNEKKVAERLERKGFSVFCPLQTVTKQWSDRKKKVQEPLFKSYVFLKCDASTRLSALQTPGIVGFVNWLGKPAVIREEEIEAIKLFLEEYDQVSVVDQRSYTPGESVEIIHGPMMGNHGQVLREKKHKVTLRIEQLGLDLVAEVPKSHLV